MRYQTSNWLKNTSQTIVILVHFYHCLETHSLINNLYHEWSPPILHSNIHNYMFNVRNLLTFPSTPYCIRTFRTLREGFNTKKSKSMVGDHTLSSPRYGRIFLKMLKASNASKWPEHILYIVDQCTTTYIN